MNREQHVLHLVGLIRAELQAQALWESQQPDARALASVAPFCVDTLAFHQWVQWLLIPRLERMIAQSVPLPDTSQIAPMAEESLPSLAADPGQLIALFTQLDRALTVD